MCKPGDVGIFSTPLEKKKPDLIKENVQVAVAIQLKIAVAQLSI